MALSNFANTYIDESNPYPQALSEAVMDVGGFTAEDEEALRRRERIAALREDTGRMDWASQANRALKGWHGGMEQKQARDAGTAYGQKVIGVGKAAQQRARDIRAARGLVRSQNNMLLGNPESSLEDQMY